MYGQPYPGSVRIAFWILALHPESPRVGQAREDLAMGTYLHHGTQPGRSFSLPFTSAPLRFLLPAPHSTALQLLFQFSDLWGQRAREGHSHKSTTISRSFSVQLQLNFFLSKPSDRSLLFPLPGDNNQGNTHAVPYSQAHLRSGLVLENTLV